MTCSACAARVQNAVSVVDGVDDCNVNLLTNTMTVSGNADNKQILKAVKKLGKFEEILETEAGCTVCSHCGPNTLGVLFIRK